MIDIDIFEIISDETNKAEQEQQAIKEATPVIKNNLDELDLIPVAYQIFKLVKGKIENGKVVGGEKTLIDTLHCDRAKNIIPNQRAIGKANILKKHDANNTYYVVGIYDQLKKRPIKKTFVVINNQIHEIIHEAKA
jgi:hypothetical protein